MTSRRIPFATRCRHPRLTADASWISQELRRTVDAPLPPDRRVPLELEQECRDRRRAGRRVGSAARRLGRIAAAGHRRAHRAHRLVVRAGRTDDEVVRIEGRALPVGRVRTLAGAAAERVDATPGTLALDLTSHPLRMIGIGLQLVDTAALLIVLGYLLNVDWSRPDPARLVTVIALALFGAGIQTVLALHLGRRLWAWRHADGDQDEPGTEFPPRVGTALMFAGLLVLVSGLAATGLFLRVHIEGAAAGEGPLASVVGLVLAASALAAPWCLVADEAYHPSPSARVMRAAGRLLGRVERKRRARLRRARRLLDAAVRRRDRAAHLVVMTLHAAGGDHLRGQRVVLLARGLAGDAVAYTAAELRSGSAATTGLLPVLGPDDHVCLHLPVERLSAAVALAELAYGAASGAARADVDLAG